MIAINDGKWTVAKEALRDAYNREISDLADQFFCGSLKRGEFGYSPGDEKICDLGNALMAGHPWCDSTMAGRLVLAVSPWAHNAKNSVNIAGDAYDCLWVSRRKRAPWDKEPPGLRCVAADCMARDIMIEAKRRGWTKRRKAA